MAGRRRLLWSDVEERDGTGRLRCLTTNVGLPAKRSAGRRQRTMRGMSVKRRPSGGVRIDTRHTADLCQGE